MLTSKQRAYLRGLAAKEDTIIQIGKDGITENTAAALSDMLRARELVKGRVLVIGSKFVLYKRNEQKPVIELPKAAKKK